MRGLAVVLAILGAAAPVAAADETVVVLPLAAPGEAEGGRVAEGAVADLTVIDPDARWLLTPEMVLSKSHNSPFFGRTLRGRVELTVTGGKVVYRRGEKPVSSAT